MNTMDSLIEELNQAPREMLEEALDFVRFLKAGRYSSALPHPQPNEEIDVVFDRARTITDLANEQRAFVASITATDCAP